MVVAEVDAANVVFSTAGPSPAAPGEQAAASTPADRSTAKERALRKGDEPRLYRSMPKENQAVIDQSPPAGDSLEKEPVESFGQCDSLRAKRRRDDIVVRKDYG